jgi:hypothetical protein
MNKFEFLDFVNKFGPAAKIKTMLFIIMYMRQYLGKYKTRRKVHRIFLNFGVQPAQNGPRTEYNFFHNTVYLHQILLTHPVAPYNFFLNKKKALTYGSYHILLEYFRQCFW